MTGTSIDSIDVALVEIRGSGLAMRATFVRGHSVPLGELVAPLRALAEQTLMAAGEIASLSRRFSEAHVRAVRELLAGERCELVCAHGQTVFHRPPVSWQMLTPAVLAAGLGVQVVSDLRAMDLARGGQGAPITPIADLVFFADVAPKVAIANLGGFCNITRLEGRNPRAVHGGDVCACNQLLDGIARTLMKQAYDEDGRRALAGAVHDAALEDLLGVLRVHAASRRSLGTGDETGEWISRWRAHVSPEDLAATACEGIADQITDQVSGLAAGVDRLLLAGGGVRNRALVRAIESCATCPVEPVDRHGVPAMYREAAEFAVLGALCQDREPITLPAVTGVVDPALISGSWVYP